MKSLNYEYQKRKAAIRERRLARDRLFRTRIKKVKTRTSRNKDGAESDVECPTRHHLVCVRRSHSFRRTGKDIAPKGVETYNRMNTPLGRILDLSICQVPAWKLLCRNLYGFVSLNIFFNNSVLQSLKEAIFLTQSVPKRFPYEYKQDEDDSSSSGDSSQFLYRSPMGPHRQRVRSWAKEMSRQLELSWQKHEARLGIGQTRKVHVEEAEVSSSKCAKRMKYLHFNLLINL